MVVIDESTRLLPDEQHCDALDEEYTKYNLSLPKFPILVSLWLGSFLSSIDSTIVANIMNKVAEEFQESQEKQWIATSFLLTNTAFQPLYGKLSDITGRKFALLTALSFFGLGCFLTSLSTNIKQFAIARAICGIGGGGINAISSITVGDICTAKDRGIYQGYANIVFGMGQLLGAPVGGLFIATIGWRALFWIQVPLVIIAIILGEMYVNIKLVHVPPPSERFKWKNISRIDFLGSFTLVSSITCFIILISTKSNVILLSLLSVLSFIAFIYVELYVSKDRILPFELLKGSFGCNSIATVISSYVIFGEIFRSPIYLQLVQDFSVIKTGIFLIFPAITTAIGSLVTGAILKRTKLDLAYCSYKLVLLGLC
ncbi:hypothetical protein Kpol_467p24, partial [Vanderwaltozyma polyspora DSM 70294]